MPVPNTIEAFLELGLRSGLLDKTTWKIGLGVDLAPRYTNWGLGIGVWR